MNIFVLYSCDFGYQLNENSGAYGLTQDVVGSELGGPLYGGV